MSDEPLNKCPTTGLKVKRSIGSGAGLIFKGSGFYETDYVRQSNGPGNSDQETNSEEAGSKQKASKDTLPTAKKKKAKS